MKIKFIQPRMSLRPMDSELKRLIAPSLALLTLASLTPKHHEVYIEDENIKELILSDEPDMVGITVNVDTSNHAYEIADIYRKKKIPVILGGIHVSANPEEALKHADSVCIGEAEELWEKILNDVQKGELKQRYYNSNPTELSKVPVLKRDFINSSQYLYTNIVVTSRGCPFSCEFCYNSCDYVHHKYRNRNIEDVLEEIKNLGTKHIMFIDDNFIGDINWTRSFLREIKPLKLKWNAAVSANIWHHLDLLDEMSDCGCQSLFIGFESINKSSTDNVNKCQNRTVDYEKLISEIHSRKIMVNASLVFGLDYDGPDTFRNTLNWLVKNKVETMTAHILTPYPGTLLYKRFMEENRIIDFNLSNYNTSQVVFRPKNLTPEELYKGYLWMYKEFYSLKNIIRRIPENREQWISYFLFSFVYRKFGKATSKIAKLGLLSKLGKLARRLSYGIG
jgi:radical SAM superfamily enzyme YgiQ (UPF0313 family)